MVLAEQLNLGGLWCDVSPDRDAVIARGGCGRGLLHSPKAVHAAASLLTANPTSTSPLDVPTPSFTFYSIVLSPFISDVTATSLMPL